MKKYGAYCHTCRKKYTTVDSEKRFKFVVSHALIKNHIVSGWREEI